VDHDVVVISASLNVVTVLSEVSAQGLARLYEWPQNLMVAVLQPSIPLFFSAEFGSVALRPERKVVIVLRLGVIGVRIIHVNKLEVQLRFVDQVLSEVVVLGGTVDGDAGNRPFAVVEEFVWLGLKDHTCQDLRIVTKEGDVVEAVVTVVAAETFNVCERLVADETDSLMLNRQVVVSIVPPKAVMILRTSALCGTSVAAGEIDALLA
jgi:hypothetical protein